MSPQLPLEVNKYQVMASAVARNLPAGCEGLRLDVIAGVIEATEKAGLLAVPESDRDRIDAACVCGAALVLYSRGEAAQRAIAEFVSMHGSCTAGGWKARSELDIERRRGMIAGVLPGSFTLPRCLKPRAMDWDERLAVVDAVLESIAAVDTYLDGEANR